MPEEKHNHAVPALPPEPEPSVPGAEPEGGPAKRAEAFMGERMAQLRERTPDEAPESGAGTAGAETAGAKGAGDERVIRATATAAGPERLTPQRLPDDYRLNLVKAYRRRQRAQLEHEHPASAPKGIPSEGETETPVAGGEDVDSDIEAHLAPPPQPPQPAPHNNWAPIGPSVLRQGQGGVKPATSGRTTGIAVAPGGDRVYIAAANGGVWRSLDAGRTWTSLMDAFDLNPTHAASDSLACGAIALAPGATPETDRLYVGSGEGSGAAYFGVGPIVSFNGGVDWITEPEAPGSTPLAGSGFYALAVDPDDPERVAAATRRGLYLRRPDGAGGFHWQWQALPGAGSTRVTSVAAAQSAGTKAFFAAAQNGPVYRSIDGGQTWSQAGTSFPGGVGRITLAIRPTQPHIVYAFTSQGTVWRLDIGDGVWRQVSGLPSPDELVRTQGWYDLAMAVAPDNENLVYLGGATIHSGGDWSGALYRCEIDVSGTHVSGNCTYIGNSIHADLHTLVFAPEEPDKLWVGCDGGVFYSTHPRSNGDIFTACNTGLATLTMEHLDQHPTEDAVVFCGTQDNGGQRYTGEETWLYSSGGDAGFQVINWRDPYRILSTYTGGGIRRSTDGGRRYSYSSTSLSHPGSVSVPLAGGEDVLFYAPLVGTPYNPDHPAEADIVAFGSVRPWISTTFGGNWRSIPDNDPASDRLVGPIRSLVFASATKLYAGTFAGWNGGHTYSQSAVYRFAKQGSGWTRTRLDTLGGAAALLLTGASVTDIAVDHADPTGNSIYLTFGGTGDYRHVWRFDGARWEARSGPGAGHVNSLLDVQHNAIATDPAHPLHVYVGADIGVWRSTDGGRTWEPFSPGLPDAAVMDLKLHAARRLLRAATHGRGVFELRLDVDAVPPVELYVRDTQLDQGRFATVNGLPDPTRPGESVRHWRGPDIKVDTPDTEGNYQFPVNAPIDFLQFIDTLTDDFRNVATHAMTTITTRVYVLVHNRGVVPADGVRVMLLLANASAGLPPLPVDHHLNVQNGTPIDTEHWTTVGIATLHDVRPGFPKVASFELTSEELPPPANLSGNNHYCVLALVHHPDDPYFSVEVHTDTNTLERRKAAHKNLLVTQFHGADAGLLAAPVQLCNAGSQAPLATDLVLHLKGYPGRVRAGLAGLETEAPLAAVIEGWDVDNHLDDFSTWAAGHKDSLEHIQAGDRPFRAVWVARRQSDIDAVLASGVLLECRNRERAVLRRVVLPPGACRTIFLLFDRPPGVGPGQAFEIEVQQWDHEREQLVGGLDLRVELAPKPNLVRRVSLGFQIHKWLWGYRIVRAYLCDANGKRLTPEHGARVHLRIEDPQALGPKTVDMRWHRSWRSFFHFLRVGAPEQVRLVASGWIDGQEVALADKVGL